MSFFFDICASTALLEDLLSTENQRSWRNLHIDLKRFLVSKSDGYSFDIYKFLGDGWILFFNEAQTSGKEMIDFCKELCGEYRKIFERRISPVLQQGNYPIGITFGIDIGTMVRIRLNRKEEYVGRPLNVAARLQAAIKSICSKRPEGKILISKNAYHILEISRHDQYEGRLVKVNLRNCSR